MSIQLKFSMLTYYDTNLDHTFRSWDVHSDKDSQDKDLAPSMTTRDRWPHTTYGSSQGLRIVAQVFHAELQLAWWHHRDQGVKYFQPQGFTKEVHKTEVLLCRGKLESWCQFPGRDSKRDSWVLLDIFLSRLGAGAQAPVQTAFSIIQYYCSRTYANSLLLANLESWFSITTFSISFPPQNFTVRSLIYVLMRSYKKMRISQKMCLQWGQYWGLLSICMQPHNEIS